MVRIIGITGGKGGTGKSTIATSLAFFLSLSKKVLLVDMDADCPNDHLILGISRNKVQTIHQRIPKFDSSKCTKCGLCGKVCVTNAIISINGREPIFMPKQCNGCGACYIKCPAKAISWDKKEVGFIFEGKKEKLDFLSGELKVNEPVSEIVINELKKLVDKRKDDYDYIIFDTAAGTHCDVISALEHVDIAIAVTEPTPLGKHDVELILKLLSILQKEKKIVLNRADIGNEEVIESLAKKFDTEIIAKVPYSKDIIKSYSNGNPIKISMMGEILAKIG